MAEVNKTVDVLVLKVLDININRIASSEILKKFFVM